MLSDDQKKARDKTYRAIQRHWKNGLTGNQIAKKLGWSKSQLDVTMTRMRATGWDLPHRHDEKRRIAAKHGKATGRKGRLWV
jgi:transposase